MYNLGTYRLHGIRGNRKFDKGAHGPCELDAFLQEGRGRQDRTGCILRYSYLFTPENPSAKPHYLCQHIICHTLCLKCAFNHTEMLVFCLHHCRNVNSAERHTTGEPAYNKQTGFIWLLACLSVCDAVVCYCSGSFQLIATSCICPAYSEKGARAQARAPTSSFGTKKTKALLKQVTGNGALGTCQDFV